MTDMVMDSPISKAMSSFLDLPMGLVAQGSILLLATLFLISLVLPARASCFKAWLLNLILNFTTSSSSSDSLLVKLPIVGTYLEVMANAHRLHDWITDHFRFCRTFELTKAGSKSIQTVDPANIEYILKTNFQNYPKGKEPHDKQHELLGDGIFNSDGNIWKRHRKIASYEFSSRKLRDFSSKVFQKNAVKLANILDSAAKCKQEVELQDLFMRLTLDSICEIAFAQDLGSLSPLMPQIPFATAFDKVTEIIFWRNMSLFWRTRRALGLGHEKQLKKYIQQLDTFTYNIIHNRRQMLEQVSHTDDQNEDLLSRFMRFRGQDEQDRYSDKDLRDSILNFVIAGRDTTAIALSWFVYLLCQNPQSAEKINEELKSLMGDQTENLGISEFCELLTPERLQEMVYLNACLNETLRLYPPVPRDGKVALKDDILPDGTKVRSGDNVIYVPYSMGRMEFLWGNDAIEFKPMRWIKDNKLQSESPYKFTTFQAGPRMCLGKDSAYLQLKIVAVVLVKFFRLELVPTHTIHYRLNITLPMINGIKVLVFKR